MDQEIWVDAHGCEGLYEVSSLGRVRSRDRKISAHGGSYTRRGRILKPVIHNTGYPVYSIHLTGGVRFQCSAHRLVILSFVGEPGPGQECRHLNGDALDPRLCNLAWGTKLENGRDRVRHGTSTRGSKSGMSKLTEKSVRETVMPLLSEGVSQQKIADELGVSQVAISCIKRGKTWRHVTGL